MLGLYGFFIELCKNRIFSTQILVQCFRKLYWFELFELNLKSQKNNICPPKP